MSREFGWIHQEMFNKLLFLKNLNKELADEIGIAYNSVLQKNTLEEAVDRSHIHESLQNYVESLMQEHAYILNHIHSIQPYKQLYENFCKKYKWNITSLEDIFGAFQKTFLNGMPCDRLVTFEKLDEDTLRIDLKENHQLKFCKNEENVQDEMQYLLTYLIGNNAKVVARNNYYLITINNHDWLNVLEKEHDNLSKVIQIMHEESLKIMNDRILNKELWEKIFYLIHEYGDNFHHKKEEEVIFLFLKEKSPAGKILVENGMLVEHELARYYIRKMKQYFKEEWNEETQVKYIGYVQAYIDLLQRHIEKENDVAFVFAKRMLDNDMVQKNFDKWGYNKVEEEMNCFIRQYYRE